ncbi:hypothetical protein F7725_008938 [Dissostichus mawsoni]|uniref:Uncharacterized protein n=1 Tax=Dissostichus mawsoni TaxID=36200 RepID=A0A7J5Z7K4_DISMA|nr:hypothetical protein F7725_008938 [Dissostichus mawsoni]
MSSLTSKSIKCNTYTFDIIPFSLYLVKVGNKARPNTKTVLLLKENRAAIEPFSTKTSESRRPRSDLLTRVYGEDVWRHIAAKEDVLWLIRTVIQQEQSLRSSSCIMDKIQDSEVEGRRKPTACFPSWSLFVLFYYSGTYRGDRIDIFTTSLATR